MPTRNVVLTDQQAAMIGRLVHSGRYQNASEVLRDGFVRRMTAGAPLSVEQYAEDGNGCRGIDADSP